MLSRKDHWQVSERRLCGSREKGRAMAFRGFSAVL